MNAVFTFSSGLVLLCVYLGQWVDSCSGQRLEIVESLYREQISPESPWRCRRHPDSAKLRTPRVQLPVTPSARRRPHPSAHLKNPVRPCECEGNICTCCVVHSSEKKDCVQFEIPYRRLSKQFKHDLSLRARGNQSTPGLNPVPFCITLSKNLGIRICVAFTNVYAQNNVFNICLRFKSVFGEKTVAEVAVDCFKFKVFPENKTNATTGWPEINSNNGKKTTWL